MYQGIDNTVNREETLKKTQHFIELGYSMQYNNLETF